MSASRKSRGRPKGSVSPQGMHEDGLLELAELADTQQEVMRELARAFRRMAACHERAHAAHRKLVTAWMREHGDDTDPTPLAEVVPFPAQRAVA